MIFNFNDLSTQAKIRYNALYNVIFPHYALINSTNRLIKFRVSLCLDNVNKVSLTDKSFIFFDSVLSQLNLLGYYDIVSHNGQAVDIEIVLVKDVFALPQPIPNVLNFDFSNVNKKKLLKRNGK